MNATVQPASPLGLGFLQTSSTSTQSSKPNSRRDELLWRAWSEGKLRWLLNENQKQVYDISREWEKRDPTLEPGNFPRVFNYDIGRRWGKTTVRFAMRCEDAIRNPGSIYRISSAYQKNIQEIVNDVSRYVLETCPNELRPVFKQQQQLFYFPRSRSEIRLVGLDMHPNGLRGQACDGDDLDEAAFIEKLEYTIKNVLYPQYQGKPWARIYLISSAPVKSESDYDEKFVEDAKTRAAYVYRTIDDNPMLSHEEREEFIRAAGGRDHHDCQREYFNVRVRDPEGSVVPEFVVGRHVTRHETPRYAHCYVGADPGTRDKFGLVFGYWDFVRAKLVIQRSWAERNASLADVAEVIRATEEELWGAHTDKAMARPPDADSVCDTPEPLLYWDGADLRSNPHRRVSDTDGATLTTLKKDHGIVFNGADKRHAKHAQDAGAARRLEQPKLYILRQWMQNDMIEIWPDSGPLQHQLNAGRWNLQRTDFERTDAHGHLDCMMALVYLLPQIDRNANPEKPTFARGQDNVFFPPNLPEPQRRSVAELNAAFGAPRVRPARQRFR